MTDNDPKQNDRGRQYAAILNDTFMVMIDLFAEETDFKEALDRCDRLIEMTRCRAWQITIKTTC